MATNFPPWFAQIFNFWNMFIIIIVQLMVMVVILAKMGPIGRFFLRLNFAAGRKTILIAQEHTNELKFYRAKPRGRSLQVKKEMYMFLPDLKRDPDPTEKIFNETLKKPAHMDGNPVYMGAVSASIAANPHLMSIISVAKTGPKMLRTFFEGLKDRYDEKISEVRLMTKINLQDLSEIMNFVITPQRLEAVFREGELAGLNRYRQRDNVLLGVIIVLTLAVVGLAFIVLRFAPPG